MTFPQTCVHMSIFFYGNGSPQIVMLLSKNNFATTHRNSSNILFIIHTQEFNHNVAAGLWLPVCKNLDDRPGSHSASHSKNKTAIYGVQKCVLVLCFIYEHILYKYLIPTNFSYILLRISSLYLALVFF